MSVVALVIAPSIAMSADDATAYADNSLQTEEVSISKEVKVKMENNDDGTVKATVVTVTNENGEETTDEKSFEGTEEEVKAEIEALKEDGVEVKVKTKKVIKEIEEEIEDN